MSKKRLVQLYVPPPSTTPVSSKALTTKAGRLYHLIVAYMIQHHHPPCLREMCELMHSRSTSLMTYYLKTLRDWGWIEMKGGLCRTIQLTRPTEKGCDLRTLAEFYPQLPAESGQPAVIRRRSAARTLTLLAAPDDRGSKLQAAADQLHLTRRDRIRAQIAPFDAEKETA